MVRQIHIGTIIREKLEEKGMSQAEFARRLRKTPGGVRYIFDSQGINTDFLMEIGEILDYDFFQHFVASGSKAALGVAGKVRKRVSVLIEIDEVDKQEKILKLVAASIKQ